MRFGVIVGHLGVIVGHFGALWGQSVLLESILGWFEGILG